MKFHVGCFCDFSNQYSSNHSYFGLTFLFFHILSSSSIPFHNIYIYIGNLIYSLSLSYPFELMCNMLNQKMNQMKRLEQYIKSQNLAEDDSSSNINGSVIPSSILGCTLQIRE